MKQESTSLLEYFVDPFVINHPKGHTIPELGACKENLIFSFSSSRIAVHSSNLLFFFNFPIIPR